MFDTLYPLSGCSINALVVALDATDDTVAATQWGHRPRGGAFTPDPCRRLQAPARDQAKHRAFGGEGLAAWCATSGLHPSPTLSHILELAA